MFKAKNWKECWEKPKLKHKHIFLDGIKSLDEFYLNADTSSYEFNHFLSLLMKSLNNDFVFYKLFKKNNELEELCLKYAKCSFLEFKSYMDKNKYPLFLPNINYFKDVLKNIKNLYNINIPDKYLLKLIKNSYGQENDNSDNPKKYYPSKKEFEYWADIFLHEIKYDKSYKEIKKIHNKP